MAAVLARGTPALQGNLLLHAPPPSEIEGTHRHKASSRGPASGLHSLSTLTDFCRSSRKTLFPAHVARPLSGVLHQDARSLCRTRREGRQWPPWGPNSPGPGPGNKMLPAFPGPQCEVSMEQTGEPSQEETCEVAKGSPGQHHKLLQDWLGQLCKGLSVSRVGPPSP